MVKKQLCVCYQERNNTIYSISQFCIQFWAEDSNQLCAMKEGKRVNESDLYIIASIKVRK